MKNFIKIVLVVIIIAVGVLIYTRAPHDGKTILIGSSLPLTGKSASLGERVEKSMNIALEEVNANADYKFKVIYEDDKGDPTTAVTIANKFISSDGVKIMIGLPKSDPLLA